MGFDGFNSLQIVFQFVNVEKTSASREEPVVVVGGTLEPEIWVSVVVTEIWDLGICDSDCHPVFKLSLCL